jgi:hypothetical protein
MAKLGFEQDLKFINSMEQSVLEKLIISQIVRNSAHFMESESSYEPASGPWSEPN